MTAITVFEFKIVVRKYGGYSNGSRLWSDGGYSKSKPMTEEIFLLLITALVLMQTFSEVTGCQREAGKSGRSSSQRAARIRHHKSYN